MTSEDDAIAASISRHGWHMIAVEAGEDEPAFVYTIGLCRSLQHPEIMLFGLAPRMSHAILSDLVMDLRAGKSYASTGAYSGLLETAQVAIRPVHSSRHITHMGYAVAYYRRLGERERLAAVQLFWPDKAGRFPFESGCDPPTVERQPRMELGVPKSGLDAFLSKWSGLT